MKRVCDGTVLIVNSLPRALARYEESLRNVLSSSLSCPIVTFTEDGDGHTSAWMKLRSAITILLNRVVRAQSARARTIIVAWPLFGYLDLLTWAIAARKSHVICIIHDPVPLQKQIGNSWFARSVFKLVACTANITTVCHTKLARDELENQTGVSAVVVDHPFTNCSPPKVLTSGSAGAIRVLGQHKEARTLAPLFEIAKSSLASTHSLEVYGKGWPAMPGWQVTSDFIPEAEFESLLVDASCIVIPYARFFQSGVAVRALEYHVPVVAPRHEQIETLFGADWPGIVDCKRTWIEAISNVQTVEPSVLQDLATRAQQRSEESWAWLIDGQHEAGAQK